ncbi:MAG TPA: exodeoxyribonuclease VII small subunit [Abditibacteriaceae bacterium]|jgi:exodeoxyribonuclease VII small subunit
MPSKTQAQSADLSFEAALRELDEVVAALEAGHISLEESLRLLQRGITLADSCDATLAKAEATLEQLVATSGGELTTQRIEWDDDDEDAEDDDSA